MKRSTIWLASALALVAACNGDSPTNPGAAPTVLSTVPASSATGIPRNVSVTATFSEAMTSSTLNTNTFELRNGATLIAARRAAGGDQPTSTPREDVDVAEVGHVDL